MQILPELEMINYRAMNDEKRESLAIVPWKVLVKTTVESLLAFYVATFCLAVFFMHRGENWLLPGIILIVLYLFIIIVCARRVFKKLSMAAIFLIIPIAPLLALIMVVSLIPVLQWLR